MKRLAVALAFFSIPLAAGAQMAGPPAIAQPGDAALTAYCDGLLSLEQSYALGRKWGDAWNSTDPNRVMALYTPDFEFKARGILNNARISNPTGVLHGQADNRNRWFGAQTVLPAGANFRMIGVYAGVRSIAVHYLSARSEPVVEVMEYTPDCKIERSNAMYGATPVGIAPFSLTPAASKRGGG